MNIREKIKTIDNKIEQNKAQYNLDRETAKMFTLSLGNISKCESLTDKDVLFKEDLLERATEIKRFECSPLDKEFKKQTRIAEKQHQTFDSAFESNKKEEDKGSRSKSNLVSKNFFTFYKYRNINGFVKRSSNSKLNDLKELKYKFFITVR